MVRLYIRVVYGSWRWGALGEACSGTGSARQQRGVTVYACLVGCRRHLQIRAECVDCAYAENRSVGAAKTEEDYTRYPVPHSCPMSTTTSGRAYASPSSPVHTRQRAYARTDDGLPSARVSLFPERNFCQV